MTGDKHISRFRVAGQLLAALSVVFISVFVSHGLFASARAQSTVQLKELWRVGGDESDEGPIFGLITDLCVGRGGHLYVVDQQLNKVSVFDGDGEFVRNIGREGDGPGEYRRPYRVFLAPSGDVCVLDGRFGFISRFSRLGEYLGDITVPADSSGVVPVFRDLKETTAGTVVHGLFRENAQFVLSGDRVEEHRIVLINNEAQVKKSYFQIGFPNDDSNPVWSERTLALDHRWDVSSDGRVFVATDFLNYKVTVFDSNENDSVLSRDYHHRKRSNDEKQAVYDWATVNPNGSLPGTKYEIEDYDKDIMALYCRSAGELWVLTSRGVYDRPEGSAGVFDVFDRAGDFSHSVNLVGGGNPEFDRYVFSGNRLYVLKCFKSAIASMVGASENNRFTGLCSEPMSVICYEVESEK